MTEHSRASVRGDISVGLRAEHPLGPGAKPRSDVRGQSAPEAGNIVLFQILVSLKERSHKFVKFRQHGERVTMSAP